jgi:transcriptional regulator with PAS, ATPase and Fis domain
MNPLTQAKVLRVLEERKVERLGGNQSVPVDVRIISATHKNLTAEVDDGTFPLDLFYRLNVFPIEVPPLRERKDDILMLLEYFVKRYASRAGKIIRTIDKKTLDLFQSYEWPGNIRELRNVIEGSVVLNRSGKIEVTDLPQELLNRRTDRKAMGAVEENNQSVEVLLLCPTRKRNTSLKGVYHRKTSGESREYQSNSSSDWSPPPKSAAKLRELGIHKGEED